MLCRALHYQALCNLNVLGSSEYALFKGTVRVQTEGKRQRVPEAVLAAAAAEAAARKEAMQEASRDFSKEEPLLMVCACDRWDRVLALDLQEAWRGTNASLVEVAPALFRVRGEVPACPVDQTSQAQPDACSKAEGPILPEGTFDRTCVWHTAGVRRCLQLLTLPSLPASLIEAVSQTPLNFPEGWSLEHEGPHPVRYESLAPYTQSSGFLAASLGRLISGPIADKQENESETRLVTVEMINSEGLHFLARDCLRFNRFNPSAFGSIWRSRPYPDYSAALEPLAALALVGIGLRVHHRLAGKDPHAFLDVTCGTGTVAAAAKYCVSAWQIFAGDVNPTMSKRSLANLLAAFPGQAYELLDEVSSSDPSPGIGVRQWDATNPWPIPARAQGEGFDGDGFLVASNLPWGKSLDTQVEAATHVAQSLARHLPRATLCLIAPEEVRRNCSDWFHVLHSAPAGKKAVLIVGHGIREEKASACCDASVCLIPLARVAPLRGNELQRPCCRAVRQNACRQTYFLETRDLSQERAERVKEAKKAKQDAAAPAAAKKAKGCQDNRPSKVWILDEFWLHKGEDLLESLYGGLPPPDPKKVRKLEQALHKLCMTGRLHGFEGTVLGSLPSARLALRHIVETTGAMIACSVFRVAARSAHASEADLLTAEWAGGCRSMGGVIT
eukprot:Skav225259  [mRNA]  locus=scaffold4099:24562:29819:+ [translate_table: standard]